MKRSQRIDDIRACIGKRSVAWFGTRGTDAAPLEALGRLHCVVSQVAPMVDEQTSETVQFCLETRRGLRRDLDRYDIDADLHRSASELKQFLLDNVGNDILVAYRPAEFLSAAFFCRPSLVAANFHLSQRQFEYKPWVEKELHAYDPDLPVLRWTYLRSNDCAAAATALAKGPLVARNTTGSGGADVYHFADAEEFEQNRPRHRDHFVGITRYLADATPLNVNAVVYRDGTVAVFAVSFQLIGLKGLTKRRFGFGGNDFAAAASLSSDIVQRIGAATATAGKWLASRGYCGVFGIDLLLDGETPLITEINARFQASTPVGATINQHAGQPDPMTEHVAAFLGLSAPKMPSIAEQVRTARFVSGEGGVVAHVIHRNIRDAEVMVRLDGAALPPGVTLQSVPEKLVLVEPEAMLFKSLHTGPITSDGYSVTDDVIATRYSASTRY